MRAKSKPVSRQHSGDKAGDLRRGVDFSGSGDMFVRQPFGASHRMCWLIFQNTMNNKKDTDSTDRAKNLTTSLTSLIPYYILTKL